MDSEERNRLDFEHPNRTRLRVSRAAALYGKREVVHSGRSAESKDRWLNLIPFQIRDYGRQVISKPPPS